MTLVRGTFYGATRIITTEKFAPELIIRLIPQYNISFVMSAASHVISMQKCPSIDSVDFSSIRHYFCSGNRIPVDLPAKANRYFPNGDLIICMGLTEVCGAFSNAFLKICDATSVGQLSHNVTVKIGDGRGNLCGVEVDGEVYVKRIYTVLGYYRNPTATAQLIDFDGFLKTGDIGHFDKNGNLYIVERKVDLLTYCNNQIAPSTIENILIMSSDVEAVCVVGIHDIVAADLPAAAVIRKTDSKITKEEIAARVAGK